MLVEDSFIVNLNSNDANCNQLNGDMMSSVVFDIKGILKRDSHISHTKVGILSAQFPVSFYSINSNNNRLDYSISAINYSLILTPGSYTGYSFILEATSKFLANGHTVVMVQSMTTGKITLTMTIPTLADITLYATSTARSAFGFKADISSTSFSLLFPYQANLLGPKRLNVTSTALPTVNSDGSLASIPVDSVACIQYQNGFGLVHMLRTDTINTIDINIVDENGWFIDFVGIPWTMTLLIVNQRILTSGRDEAQST
jgi:hypothetical protein